MPAAAKLRVFGKKTRFTKWKLFDLYCLLSVIIPQVFVAFFFVNTEPLEGLFGNSFEASNSADFIGTVLNSPEGSPKHTCERISFTNRWWMWYVPGYGS